MCFCLAYIFCIDLLQLGANLLFGAKWQNKMKHVLVIQGFVSLKVFEEHCNSSPLIFPMPNPFGMYTYGATYYRIKPKVTCPKEINKQTKTAVNFCKFL